MTQCLSRSCCGSRWGCGQWINAALTFAALFELRIKSDLSTIRVMSWTHFSPLCLVRIKAFPKVATSVPFPHWPPVCVQLKACVSWVYARLICWRIMIMMRGLLCSWCAREGSRTLHSSLTELCFDWLLQTYIITLFLLSVTSLLWSCAKCQPSYSQLVKDSEERDFASGHVLPLLSFLLACVCVCVCLWVCTCLNSNQQWFILTWGAKGTCPWHLWEKVPHCNLRQWHCQVSTVWPATLLILTFTHRM